MNVPGFPNLTIWLRDGQRCQQCGCHETRRGHDPCKRQPCPFGRDHLLHGEEYQPQRQEDRVEPAHCHS